MNIAICGASCTGKTTVAKLLAERLSCEWRGCGSMVRNTANRLGIAPDALPENVHEQIDAETVLFVELPCVRHKVVEGRFLRYVLAKCSQPVLLIELVASLEARLSRWQGRMGPQIDVNWLNALDKADHHFAEEVYRCVEPLHPVVTIDTSRQSVFECADTIAKTC